MTYDIQDPRLQEINGIKELEYIKFHDLVITGDVDEENKQIVIPELLISYNNGKNLSYNSKDEFFEEFVHKVLEVYKEEKGKILDDSTFMPQTLKIEDQRTQNFLDKADIVNKNEITEIYEDMDSYENSLMFESHEFRTVMDIIRFVIKSFGEFSGANIELSDKVRGMRTNYFVDATVKDKTVNDNYVTFSILYHKIDDNTYDVSIGNIGGLGKELNIRIALHDDNINITSVYIDGKENFLFDYSIAVDNDKALFIKRVLKNGKSILFEPTKLQEEVPQEMNLVELSGSTEGFTWYKLPWTAYYGYKGNVDKINDTTSITYRHVVYLDVNNEDFYKRDFYTKKVARNRTLTKVGVNLTTDEIRKATFGCARSPYFVIETCFKNTRGDGNYRAKFNNRYFYHVVKAKNLNEIKKDKLKPVSRDMVLRNTDLISNEKLKIIGGK